MELELPVPAPEELVMVRELGLLSEPRAAPMDPGSSRFQHIGEILVISGWILDTYG